MAFEYLDSLRNTLPGLFEDLPIAPDWDDDWYVWRTEDAGESALTEQIATLVDETDEPSVPSRELPFSDLDLFPGRPDPDVLRQPGGIERLAFYLPYHFFHPTWWGIYILIEGWVSLARQLVKAAHGSLHPYPAAVAAFRFLYRHELFHHNTEVFATRLEVVQRIPRYRTGVRSLYAQTLGTDDCTEEALANGYALCRGELSRVQTEALARVVRSSPPGYRRGVDYATESTLDRGMNEFAEELLHTGPHRTAVNAEVWGAFSHSFTGRIRTTSRVNYLLPKRSPLVARLPLRQLAPLTTRKLKKGLKKIGGCRFERQGGNHEIWEAPDGGRFPVPRHPGDLHTGTLRDILKQAGIDMSVQQFAAQV